MTKNPQRHQNFLDTETGFGNNFYSIVMLCRFAGTLDEKMLSSFAVAL